MGLKLFQPVYLKEIPRGFEYAEMRHNMMMSF